MKLYPKLFLGWIIISLILTWTPGEALPKPDFLNISFAGFIAHFGMFLVFSFLLTGILFGEKNKEVSKQKVAVFVILWSLFFSLVTETGQYFIPGRHFHWLDMIINFLGTAIGIWIFFLKFKYFSN